MRVGTWVSLKKRVRAGPQKARIESEHDGMAEGAVFLLPPLDGCRWWNKEDLVEVPAPKRRKK